MEEDTTLQGTATNRRTFLEAIGAASAVGVTVTTAGCLGDGDADDDDDIEGADELGDPVPEIELLSPTAGVNAFRNELSSMIAENWRELGFEVSISTSQRFGTDNRNRRRMSLEAR